MAKKSAQSKDEWPFPEGTEPKGKTRAHSAIATLENVDLAKATRALTVELFVNGGVIGTLEIGKGSLFWRGKGRKKKGQIDWSKFAEMMDSLAYSK